MSLKPLYQDNMHVDSRTLAFEACLFSDCWNGHISIILRFHGFVYILSQYLKDFDCYIWFVLIKISGLSLGQNLAVFNDDTITLAIKPRNQEGKHGAWYLEAAYQIFLSYAFKQVTYFKNSDASVLCIHILPENFHLLISSLFL